MTLPGMPIAVGDPGVFVCGPRDIAPWETEEPAPAAPRKRAPVSGAGWIVLNTCPACVKLRNYCRRHDLKWLDGK